MPGEQAVHCDAPPLAEVPATQSVHVREPRLEVAFPAGQDRQVLAPLALAYVPTSQSWQDMAPAILELFPAGHEVQTPFSPYSPALQFTQLMDPAVEALVLPLGHASQLLLPEELCHFPLGQSAHLLVPVELSVYFPLGHAGQGDDWSLTLEYLPRGQLSQETAPGDEDLPTPQLRHTVAPDETLLDPFEAYLPPGH